MVVMPEELLAGAKTYLAAVNDILPVMSPGSNEWNKLTAQKDRLLALIKKLENRVADEMS